MVLASRGDVQFIKNNGAGPLKQGDFISVGYEVISGQRSFAVLQMFDGAKLSIRPETRVKIIRFDMSGDAGGEALLELSQGGIKLAVGTIATENPTGFRIRTPFSILFVSESEATVGLCDNTVCEQSGLEEIRQ